MIHSLSISAQQQSCIAELKSSIQQSLLKYPLSLLEQLVVFNSRSHLINAIGIEIARIVYIARGNLSSLMPVVITGVPYLNMTPETYCMRTATLRRRCRKVKDADDHQAVMAFVASTTSSGEEASH